MVSKNSGYKVGYLEMIFFQGEIEVRFVSAAGEAALRIGDVCQMAESIAFFEAYRPVLEGLQSMSYGKFPLQVNYHHY